MHNSTDKRIAELEDLLVETERQLIALHRGEGAVDGPPPPPNPPAPPAPPPPAAPKGPPPPPPSAVPAPSSSLTAEMLLRYSGIAMVIASAIFFVSTAINRGWIGPVAQLVLATIASLGMIASSFRFRDAQRPWAITMSIGGATSLFVSGVVGFVGLDLLSFPAAVVWLVVSVASYFVLSRCHDAESVAIASVPTALAGVVVLRLGTSYDPGLLAMLGSAYLVSLAGVTYLRGWFWARTLGAMAGTGIAALGVLASIDGDLGNGALVGLFVATVVSIVAVGTAQAIEFVAVDSSDQPNPAAVLEARVAALIIPCVSVLTAAVALEIEVVSVDFFWVVAAIGSTLGLVILGLRPLTIAMRLLHGAAAIGTVAVALVAVTEGPALLVALLAQAVIAAGLAYRFRTFDMIVLASVLGTTVAAMTAGEILNGALVDGLSVTGSLSVLAVVAASGFAAWILRRDGHSDSAWAITWLLSLGWAAASFRDVPQGQMIVTLVWAIIGVALVVGGSRLRDATFVHAGFVTLAVTSAKLIFVDLVAVDVLWRAALFFVVGSLFLRLAFMLPKLTAEPSSAPDDVVEVMDPPFVDSGVGRS